MTRRTETVRSSADRATDAAPDLILQGYQRWWGYCHRRFNRCSIRHNDGWRLRAYFVILGLVGVGGVAAAGERLNVSQTFQPAGRFSLANSP